MDTDALRPKRKGKVDKPKNRAQNEHNVCFNKSEYVQLLEDDLLKQHKVIA